MKEARLNKAYFGHRAARLLLDRSGCARFGFAPGKMHAGHREFMLRDRYYREEVGYVVYSLTAMHSSVGWT